jgi:DNA-binding CsgD family transcriptional regulator
MGGVLAQGRDFYHRRVWTDAYRSLACADQTQPLGREDLELFGTSAYLSGQDAEFQNILERCHRAHLAAGDNMRAARSGFWLALNSLLNGQVGPATGWLARARRLIESCDCVEHGYLLLPVAEQNLAEGKTDDAQTAAMNAGEIGLRFNDADLIACARHLQGRVFIQRGQTREGLALLDEAMLAVVAGELSPIMTGLMYCSVIDACQQVFALSRSREWTSAFAGWCEQQPEMMAFTGTCLVHRAEILQFTGAWPDAMNEAARACERCTRANRRPPAGAYYQQGEILRLRGSFTAGENAYLRASELGCEPQPGLALLRMAQGRLDVARAAISRAVDAATEPLHRTRLLPAYIEIMLAAGEIQDARRASSELEGFANHIATDVLHALAGHARGAVELADGDARTAIVLLRRAFDIWQQLEVPYDAARARVLLGVACRSLGDTETAALEFRAARSALERLGAAPDLARLDVIERGETSPRPQVLTSRELQVLRLVAAGKTNKSIARELSLSERTVDRHISNILTKLSVPSRTAAITYAYHYKLF